jgi:hypothetical protein
MESPAAPRADWVPRDITHTWIWARKVDSDQKCFFLVTDRRHLAHRHSATASSSRVPLGTERGYRRHGRRERCMFWLMQPCNMGIAPLFPREVDCRDALQATSPHTGCSPTSRHLVRIFIPPLHHLPAPRRAWKCGCEAQALSSYAADGAPRKVGEPHFDRAIRLSWPCSILHWLRRAPEPFGYLTYVLPTSDRGHRLPHLQAFRQSPVPAQL